MKLENTYFVTQIFAGIAVVLSLIFVGLSVRQNTAAIRSQELAGIIEQGQARQLISISTDFRDIYTKSLISPNELTIGELYSYSSYISFRLNNLSRTRSAYKSGILTEEDWVRDLETVPIFLGSKTGQIMWEEFKGEYYANPGFVNEIEASLKNSPIVPDDEWILNLQKKFQNP